MDIEDDAKEQADNNDNEDNNTNDNNNNNNELEDQQMSLREKALEALGFLLELPREDMLPYFQEIGAALAANLETQVDLGKNTIFLLLFFD